MGIAYTYRVLNLRKTAHLEGHGIDGRIILQWMLKIKDGEAGTGAT